MKQHSIIALRFFGMLVVFFLGICSTADAMEKPIGTLSGGDNRCEAFPVLIYCSFNVPAIQFAAHDLQQALDKQGSRSELLSISKMSAKQEHTRFVLGLAQNELFLKRMEAAGVTSPGISVPEGYAIRLTRQDNHVTVWAIGADATGTMYAGLALAETIAQDGVKEIKEADCKPYIGKRGLKINIPLDARTPAYADCGDAAQQNMLVMWDLDFWKQHLDAMARDRYNTITLWNAHPFPSMVKVPDYPDVALEDVKIADIDWLEWFPKYAGKGGANGITQEIFENLKTIKKISIDEKIEFWREVMTYAHNRGVEFHIMTWNIFIWGTEGKYGITDAVTNEVTIDYIRKSVQTLFETYPLLAGIGVTAGEHMKGLATEVKEQWLWKTYGLGVMDVKQQQVGRPIRFMHRYWMSKIPEITKHFDEFDEDIQFDFSYKYARARLYSHTDPGFVDEILESAPEGTKWWWNLRNDDIFYFRWGDPDYVREYVLNFPPAEQTVGFYMGSDGYVWGREFVSTDPEIPRQLEIEKHWYKFMLWGRLGYDPNLSNSFFEKTMQQRFPGKPTKMLQEVWTRSSKIIPAVNRTHWHNWDANWAVETCQGRQGFHHITDDCWGEGDSSVAKEIKAHANYVLQKLVELKKIEGDKVWQRTLGDIEAMAHLGNYYAEKLRASDYVTRPGLAVKHLENAAVNWKKYADIGKKQYKSQLLSKGGWFDWQEGYENVLKDISLMKEKEKERENRQNDLLKMTTPQGKY